MATRIETVKLGTMIQVAEVSKMTGIPVGTIRLWRQPKYKHLAQIEAYDQHGTRAKWYRLADVEAWLEVNVKPDSFDGFSVSDEAPNAIKAPINADAEPYDYKRIEVLNAAKRITRTNWEKIRNEITKPFDNPTMMILAAKKKWGEELTEFWFKDDLEAWRPLVHHYPNDPNFPQYGVAPAPEDVTRTNFILVQLTRLMDAEIAGRQLTVADVVTLPVD